MGKDRRRGIFVHRKKTNQRDPMSGGAKCHMLGGGKKQSNIFWLVLVLFGRTIEGRVGKEGEEKSSHVHTK